jgi:hypothetical protein
LQGIGGEVGLGCGVLVGVWLAVSVIVGVSEGSSGVLVALGSGVCVVASACIVSVRALNMLAAIRVSTAATSRVGEAAPGAAQAVSTALPASSRMIKRTFLSNIVSLDYWLANFPRTAISGKIQPNSLISIGELLFMLVGP